MKGSIIPTWLGIEARSPGRLRVSLWMARSIMARSTTAPCVCGRCGACHLLRERLRSSGTRISRAPVGSLHEAPNGLRNRCRLIPQARLAIVTDVFRTAAIFHRPADGAKPIF